VAAQTQESPPGDPWEALRGLGRTGQEGAAEEIADRIQELILAREVADGSRLPSERDLAALLSTSRPTVSQAIRILVIKGLVESRRGSGAYVRLRPGASLATAMELMLEVDPGSVGQLAEVRLTLESEAVVRAIERASAAELDPAEEALNAFAHTGGDTASWMSADTRFHSALVGAAHNTFLASMFESVHSALINHEYRSWIDSGTVPEWLAPDRIPALTAIHEPILSAVRRRDVGSALYAVRHHHEAMTVHLGLAG
jgi:GntR family transcriptional regulator, transcriptional repressor for pyruvate dehydrogenase complex